MKNQEQFWEATMYAKTVIKVLFPQFPLIPYPGVR
jgi:hypothetical protein